MPNLIGGAGDLFREIDTDLSTILPHLEEPAETATPTGIISLEARQLVAKAAEIFCEVIGNNHGGNGFSPKRIADVIAERVPDLQFRGDENIGFTIVPGVERISPLDIPRHLVLAYIDFARASLKELQQLGHYHVGATVTDTNGAEWVLPAEYAQVWAPDKGPFKDDFGLVWSGKDKRVHVHTAQDGIRVAPHGSYDDYSVMARLPEDQKSTLPQFYIGPYYGGVDMRSRTFPEIRQLSKIR